MAIRWKNADYLTLGRAVANFNKKINRLNAEEKKLYLPDNINYKDVKGRIQTRKELNRILNSLRSFSKEGAEDLYITEAGELMTKWERQELSKQTRIAENSLRKELKELEKPYSSGYSKAQMGSITYKNILAQIRNLRKLEQKKGYEFTKLKDRIKNIGSLDYDMVKATIYRENFMYAISFSEGMEGYDLLLKRLNRIKNPVNFYNFVKKSNVFSDIFLYYKPGEGLVYGGFNSNQERFNHGLEELGIVEDEKRNLINKIERRINKQSYSIKEEINKNLNIRKWKELLVQAKSISDANDLFNVMNNYNNVSASKNYKIR